MSTIQILLPHTILFGQKYFAQLNEMSGKKLFVFSKSFKKNHETFFNEIVSKNEFIEQVGEPTQAHVDNITKALESAKAVRIVAVGGGSVIDATKIVKTNLKIPMTAVPTTIGSGSEVSRYSLLVDLVKKTKKVVTVELPESVIIEPLFYKSFNKKEIAYQTIDALSHALESLVSRFSNSFSDNLALSAIENLFTELENFNVDQTIESLEKIKISATLAGIAQSSAGTGLAHSFAHYFGAHNNIPHAKAISMFLVPVVQLNQDKIKLYSKLNTLKTVSSENIISKLKHIYKIYEIEQAKLNLKEEANTAINSIRRDICTMSNPYSPTPEDIATILNLYE